MYPKAHKEVNAYFAHNAPKRHAATRDEPQVPDKKQDRENIKIDPIVKEQLDDLQYQLKRLTGDKQTQSLVIWRGLVALQREIKAGAFDREIVPVSTRPYPKQVTPALVPSSDSPTTAPVIDSGLANTLTKVRALLEIATSELDGVLTDGQSPADTLGEIKDELERTLANGRNLGARGQDNQEVRLTKPKGRRAR